MDEHTPKFVFECPAEEISSYIDGELTAEHELALERHFASCEICRAELNDQKSFLLALSHSLVTEAEISVPADFTKKIVVNAESKVSGLRDRRERMFAVAIVTAMLLVAVTVFGVDSAGAFGPARSFLSKFGAVVAMAAQIVYDLSYGLSAFFRSILSSQTFGGVTAYIIITCAAAAVIYLVSRPLIRFIRTQGSE